VKDWLRAALLTGVMLDGVTEKAPGAFMWWICLVGGAAWSLIALSEFMDGHAAGLQGKQREIA
jgi:hypothetical protein